MKNTEASTSRPQQDAQQEPTDLNPPTSRDTTCSADEADSYWSDNSASYCEPATSPQEHQQQQPQQSNNSNNPRSAQQTSRRKGSSSDHPRRCNTGRNVRKRTMANERERERTRALNQALEVLRNRLPVQESEKRSKIQTLRTAKEYIEFLDRWMRSLSQQQQQQHQQHHHQQQEDCNQTQQQQQHHQQVQQEQQQHHKPTYNNNNNNHQFGRLVAGGSGVQTNIAASQPDSPLTYKFYKFRLKSQTKGD